MYVPAFKAFHKAAEMCGNSYENRRTISKEEVEYLDALVRGVYAKKNIPAGYVVDNSTFSTYFQLAVPLRKGQLSTRELLNGLAFKEDVKLGDPITINSVSGPYSENKDLRKLIENRGI